MNTALKTAEYILDYCGYNFIMNCSNKKLQKLLYYVQAWTLAYTGKRYFNDDIEAWLHGPVVPDVYHKYKEFGFDRIEIGERDFDDKIFTENNLLNSILKHYCEYDADYLEMRTHIEAPWKEARKNGARIITPKSMREYYKSVLDNYEQKKKQLCNT